MSAAAPWLCLVCGVEVPPAEEDLEACPACGDTGRPVDTGDRVQVCLTWHELRILVMWAERWAIATGGSGGRMARVHAGIAARLADQHPERGPLTLAEEMAAMVARFGDRSPG